MPPQPPRNADRQIPIRRRVPEKESTLSNQGASKKQQRKRVILLDDSPAMAKRYANGLRNAGFWVTVYNDAKEFVTLASHAKISEPDMFVIDVMIEAGRHAFDASMTNDGTLEGIRIAQELRTTEGYGSVPIILLSCSPFPDVLEAAADAANAMRNKNGCDCIFVRKVKWTPSKLPSLVHQFFEHNHFPQAKFLKRIVLQFPIFPFVKFEFERHK